MIYSIQEKVEKSIRKSLGQVTQSSSGSLIQEFGGRGRGRVGGSAPGNGLGFILEGSSTDLRSWLWEVKHTQNNGPQSHPGEPCGNSTSKCTQDVAVSKAFTCESRQEKFYFPNDGSLCF